MKHFAPLPVLPKLATQVMTGNNFTIIGCHDLQWTSIPDGEISNTPRWLYATETRISSSSVGQFGLPLSYLFIEIIRSKISPSAKPTVLLSTFFSNFKVTIVEVKGWHKWITRMND